MIATAELFDNISLGPMILHLVIFIGFYKIEITFVTKKLYILTSILDVKFSGKKMKRKMISFKHISISMSFITDSKFLCSFKKLLTGNH